MAYNDECSGRIILDLETAPIDDAASYIEPVSAPANYKDPDKIASYCKDKQQELVDKAALDPDLCRIVAAGFLTEDGGPQIWTATDAVGEAAVLTEIWRAIGDRLIVGFNVCGFDVPVLLRRSLYLRVVSPRIAVDRFKHPRILDLMQELSFNGLLKYHGLDFYCQRFALQVPEDEVSGADIPGLVAANQWAKVHQHVESDVAKTAALAERMGHFTQVTEAVL
jgi:hypothetical protein